MDVSTIIVTRNTCEQTRQAIASVYASIGADTKEIILVDNGSTDETAAMVSGQFPDVRYCNPGCNLGFAAANNLGSRGATGEFLLLLNSDARLQPDTLATALAWMRSHPECGIAGAQLLNPDGSPQNSIANFPSLATELLNKSLLRRVFPKHFPGKEHRFTEPVEVESVVGAFMLIRHALWRALGGFDERYFFFFEETDFCLRASCQGWTVWHLPQARVWHEQGKSANEWAAAARIEYWRSRYTYFARHHNPLCQWLMAGGLGLRLGLNWTFSFLGFALSLGKRRWRDKHGVHTALVKWHLQGCPPGIGLPR